jgi:opacity protein-like surface antigen
VHVFEVSEQTAKGRLVKAYSDPMVDDLAEYLQPVVEMPVPDDAHIPDEFAQRIEDLESSVKGYEKANKTLAKTYPTFARRIWDEISAMRAYVVSLDERLVELEEQQSEDRSRLASVMTGEYRPEDLKEFTIKYTPDTLIKLQASGKTLLIGVVHDTVQINRPSMGADDAMSSSTKLTRILLLGALLCIGVGPSRAQNSAGVVADLLYVIKTTPALVYLDAGTLAGTSIGDQFLLLRENGKARFTQVGEARVVRVADEFCIAELLSVEAGYEVEVLDQAISVRDWHALADEARAAGMEPLISKPQEMTSRKDYPRTSLHILGGAEFGRKTSLVWDENLLVGAESITDAGIGLRLGKVLGRHWKLNFTWRMAGKPLGREGADITQMSLSVDTHLLFRGVDHTTPYLGVGVGGHRLTWEASKPNKDAATKGGFNLMAGIHHPVSDGLSSVLLEAGYQRVAKFDDIIDASNVRLYLGLGMNF